MRLRIATMFVLAAALSLDATAASAQGRDTTRRARSTTRIPVTKEAPGEVVMPRVDTVTIFRTDTLRVYRTDTLTVTRVDTMRVEVAPPPIPRLRQIGGFYIGLALGGAFTTGALDDGQNGGFHINMPIGIDPIGSPLGFRFDVGYTNLSTNSEFDFLENDFILDDGRVVRSGLDLGTPQIWSFNLDGKIRLPIKSPYTSRFQVYGIGGASYNHYKNLIGAGQGFVTVGDAVVSVDNDVVVIGDNDVLVADDGWHSQWGWNAGGGLQFGWGRANLYVESRVIGFRNSRDFQVGNVLLERRANLNQVPLTIGMTWY